MLDRQPDMRERYPIDDCDTLRIDEYELREVLFPVGRNEYHKVIAIVIRGRNFPTIAQPLLARVGEVPVRHTRITSDERSLEGILLQEPEEGSYVEVSLGEIVTARHATPFDPGMVDRIE